jgi:hypothetical protein
MQLARTLLVALIIGGVCQGQIATVDREREQRSYLEQLARRVSQTVLDVPNLKFEIRPDKHLASYADASSTVIVTTALVEFAFTESQFVGVVCHQVAHLRLGSAGSEPAREKQAELWTIRCSMALGFDPRGIVLLAQSIQQTNGTDIDKRLIQHLSLSRLDEFEAALRNVPIDQANESYIIDSFRFHRVMMGRPYIPEALLLSKLRKDSAFMPELTREDVARALDGKDWTYYETKGVKSYSIKDPSGVTHAETRRIAQPAVETNTQPQTLQPDPKVITSARSVLPENSRPSAAARKDLVLEDATPIKLRLMENVSSSTAHVGDIVPFEVLEEIRIGDTVVIPVGAPAWATVTEAERKKRMGRAGKLAVSLDSVRLATGQKVALRAVQGGSGGGHVGAMTGAIVATAIVFWPAAPLFLFVSGKDKTIPKGTNITAYINGNVPLDWKTFHPDVVKDEPRSQQQVLSHVDLKVSSVPDNAEIELDGNFVGTTPSTLSLAPGDYTIQVTRKGYRPWTKKIRIISGAIQISAELEKEP